MALLVCASIELSGFGQTRFKTVNHQGRGLFDQKTQIAQISQELLPKTGHIFCFFPPKRSLEVLCFGDAWPPGRLDTNITFQKNFAAFGLRRLEVPLCYQPNTFGARLNRILFGDAAQILL